MSALKKETLFESMHAALACMLLLGASGCKRPGIDTIGPLHPAQLAQQPKDPLRPGELSRAKYLPPISIENGELITPALSSTDAPIPNPCELHEKIMESEKARKRARKNKTQLPHIKS